MAGLIAMRNSNKLVIALEPEAASTFCRSLKDHSSRSQKELQLKIDQKILIIDAGGNVSSLSLNFKFEHLICAISELKCT